jgi:hypothetical protein
MIASSSGPPGELVFGAVTVVAAVVDDDEAETSIGELVFTPQKAHPANAMVPEEFAVIVGAVSGGTY